LTEESKAPVTEESPLDRLEAMLAENSDVPPELLLQAAGQANQLLGEALQRAVSFYNLMSGMLHEFVQGIETIDVAQSDEKENA